LSALTNAPADVTGRQAAAAAPGSAAPDSVTPDSVTPDSVTPDSVTPDSVAPDSVAPRPRGSSQVQAAPLRLMAVHAHPDDESSKGAASMARYVREGVDVMVCTLTGGERGSILNKAMDRPEVRANLPRIRREEMARAREILGVRQEFLGFTDSGLPEGDPLPPLPDGCFALKSLEEASYPLVRAVREFRPHVMLTYDEEGGYPHPDHIKCHQVSVEAFEAAADPDRYPGTGDPWQPLKLYYFATFHKERLMALHEEMLRRGLESPYAEWLARWQDSPDGRPALDITTRVPCAEFFGLRDQALIAHATQIDPESSWFACPREVQRAAWPTEDYHLARSVVDTERPEDDLFAGVRERVSL
jgi:mycothiol S-conjugate amidase